jgi:hypothetical protein
MADPKSTQQSADWTNLLTDPELVSHLGELLQTYREAAPEKREEALIQAMREIKRNSSGKVEQQSCSAKEVIAGTDVPAMNSEDLRFTESSEVPASLPAPTPPPFEPDIFTPSWGQDRRKFPRMKCFVAVELHIKGSPTPIWGNLSNTSMGGCFVESVTPIHSGSEVEIGLWVSSGKIWVKGIVLTGVVTKTAPAFGIRVKFGQMETNERESLREFLKFVENTTKGYEKQNGYLAQLKR